ncbi:MAG TPA: Gfo/Idh/MocA family oxidoreductase [bacterium]|nr:Gfo/Idh/MocA family oxidoreductase [bacterium]
MKKRYNRREFLKVSGSAIGSMGFAGLAIPGMARSAMQTSEQPVRLGFVGIGGRGSYHLDSALGIPGVEVPALCEIRDDRLQRAREWVEQSGRPTPGLYGRTETDFRRMCETEELDAVICSTNWKWHAPVCLSAMRNEKHAVTEVPIIQTVDEAWDIVETYEKTGYWATLALEQVLLESSGGLYLTILNMIRQGMFGDIIHAEGGYIHDLRFVKHDPEREPWRLQHSIDRNGNLYPDHPMNRIMPHMDINHGDRFDKIVSMSSKAVMLNRYAREYYGPDHPNVTMDMNQGDYNASLIRTVNGKLVTLNFDTNTPHPRGLYRMQGSEGVFLDGRGLSGPQVYFDGISPEAHEWEPADEYITEHKHPALKNYNPSERQAIRGHGSGSRETPLTWHLLVKNLREDTMPYFDVYDSVTGSVTSPLSEQSVANRSRPVEYPDFTRGKWKTRPPISIEV